MSNNFRKWLLGSIIVPILMFGYEHCFNSEQEEKTSTNGIISNGSNNIINQDNSSITIVNNNNTTTVTKPVDNIKKEHPKRTDDVKKTSNVSTTSETSERTPIIPSEPIEQIFKNCEQKGRVFLGYSDSGLAGAEVFFEENPNISAITDTTGKFKLIVPEKYAGKRNTIIIKYNNQEATFNAKKVCNDNPLTFSFTLKNI